MRIVMVVVSVFPGELQGVDTVAKRDQPGLICAGVMQQFLQPIDLKAKADGQHNVCVPPLWQRLELLA